MSDLSDHLVLALDTAADRYDRMSAIRNLGSMALEADVLPAWERLVRDPELRIRQEAVKILIALDAQEVHLALMLALQDDDEYIVRDALKALQSSADPVIARAIEERIPSLEYSSTRKVANDVLSRIKSRLPEPTQTNDSVAETGQNLGNFPEYEKKAEAGSKDEPQRNVEPEQNDVSIIKSVGIKGGDAETPPTSSFAGTTTSFYVPEISDQGDSFLKPRAKKEPEKDVISETPLITDEPDASDIDPGAIAPVVVEPPRKKSLCQISNANEKKKPARILKSAFWIVAFMFCLLVVAIAFAVLVLRPEPEPDFANMKQLPRQRNAYQGPTTTNPLPVPTPQPEIVASSPEAQVPKTEALSLKVKIPIVYSSEKKDWLQSAITLYGQEVDGGAADFELLDMGSQESVAELAREKVRPLLWMPADSIALLQFQAQKLSDKLTIEDVTSIAHSPLVLIFWKERLDALHSVYPELTMRSLTEAARREDGWKGIANKPEWGFFRFGHTRPDTSNSGLQALLFMTSDYLGKSTSLQVSDLQNTPFQEWLVISEKRFCGFRTSSRAMMKEMIQKGPSAYDGLFIYESLAIEYATSARNRWGELQVVYPRFQVNADHPCVLMSSKIFTREQILVARNFRNFLLQPNVQRMALAYGLRPVSPTLLRETGSPFIKNQELGLQTQLPESMEAPSSEVIQELTRLWEQKVPPLRP